MKRSATGLSDVLRPKAKAKAGAKQRELSPAEQAEIKAAFNNAEKILKVYERKQHVKCEKKLLDNRDIQMINELGENNLDVFKYLNQDYFSDYDTPAVPRHFKLTDPNFLLGRNCWADVNYGRKKQAAAWVKSLVGFYIPKTNCYMIYTKLQSDEVLKINRQNSSNVIAGVASEDSTKGLESVIEQSTDNATDDLNTSKEMSLTSDVTLPEKSNVPITLWKRRNARLVKIPPYITSFDVPVSGWDEVLVVKADVLLAGNGPVKLICGLQKLKFDCNCPEHVTGAELIRHPLPNTAAFLPVGTDPATPAFDPIFVGDKVICKTLDDQPAGVVKKVLPPRGDMVYYEILVDGRENEQPRTQIELVEKVDRSSKSTPSNAIVEVGDQVTCLRLNDQVGEVVEIIPAFHPVDMPPKYNEEICTFYRIKLKNYILQATESEIKPLPKMKKEKKVAPVSIPKPVITYESIIVGDKVVCQGLSGEPEGEVIEAHPSSDAAKSWYLVKLLNKKNKTFKEFRPKLKLIHPTPSPKAAAAPKSPKAKPQPLESSPRAPVLQPLSVGDKVTLTALPNQPVGEVVEAHLNDDSSKEFYLIKLPTKKGNYKEFRSRLKLIKQISASPTNSREISSLAMSTKPAPSVTKKRERSSSPERPVIKQKERSMSPERPKPSSPKISTPIIPEIDVGDRVFVLQVPGKPIGEVMEVLRPTDPSKPMSFMVKLPNKKHNFKASKEKVKLVPKDGTVSSPVTSKESSSSGSSILETPPSPSKAPAIITSPSLAPAPGPGAGLSSLMNKFSAPKPKVSSSITLPPSLAGLKRKDTASSTDSILGPPKEVGRVPSPDASTPTNWRSPMLHPSLNQEKGVKGGAKGSNMKGGKGANYYGDSDQNTSYFNAKGSGKGNQFQPRWMQNERPRAPFQHPGGFEARPSYKGGEKGKDKGTEQAKGKGKGSPQTPFLPDPFNPMAALPNLAKGGEKGLPKGGDKGGAAQKGWKGGKAADKGKGGGWTPWGKGKGKGTSPWISPEQTLNHEQTDRSGHLSEYARTIRIQCELEEPRMRLERQGVENVVMFFGSARAKSREQYDAAVLALKTKLVEQRCSADESLLGQHEMMMEQLNEALSPVDDNACEEHQEAAKQEKTDQQKQWITADESTWKALNRMLKQNFLIKYYDETIELARMLTEWSKQRVAENPEAPEYHVGTGGGPGMMSAANQGAWIANGKSVGFGISVPFEDGLNPYVTPELAFEFHYFFTRKFWMAYKMMGLIIAPGGYGTCDELFELLTLMQTRKIKRHVPVILLGKKFWESVLNLQSMVDHGMISQDDMDRVHLADDAKEAFEIWSREIAILEDEEAAHPTVPMSPKRASMMVSRENSPHKFNAY